MLARWFAAKSGALVPLSHIRLSRLFRPSALVAAALLSSSQLALARFAQQGSKLVGTGAIGAADQGWSVALSSDGNTPIVGGGFDNGGAGAAWVFTRTGTAWTQQQKLVGTGAIGTIVFQGGSVALSSDGNTAIVGGVGDNGNAGAAWVFVTPATVPFLAFNAAFQIKFGKKPNQDAFALESGFTLSGSAPAINPGTQPVMLQVGTFTTTIRPAPFNRSEMGFLSLPG